MLTGLTRQWGKLEFGGESPLTMRYGLRVENPTSFGPLDRNCVGYIEQTTTAKTNRACPKDGKITTQAKARIARGGIPTNNNLTRGHSPLSSEYNRFWLIKKNSISLCFYSIIIPKKCFSIGLKFAGIQKVTCNAP